MPRHPRGSRKKRVHRSSTKRKKHFPGRRSSQKKKNRHNLQNPTQQQRKKRVILEDGTKICIRKQVEGVGCILHGNSKKDAYLIRFKNGAVGWYRYNKIKPILEDEYDGAASDFEIDKNLPSPSPTPSIAESSYLSATPSAVESEGDTHSEFDAQNNDENDDVHHSNDVNAVTSSSSSMSTNTVTSDHTESDHKMEIPDVSITELFEPIDTVNDTVNDIDTVSMEAVNQKESEQNMEIETAPIHEVEEKSSAMTAVCDPMESGNDSDSEILDEIDFVPNPPVISTVNLTENPIANGPESESKMEFEEHVENQENQRVLTLQNSYSHELIEGDDASQIAVIDAVDDTESKVEETRNIESNDMQNEIVAVVVDSVKEKKRKTKKKRKKTKSVDSVKMKVEVSKFEKKMKMYYKVSDLRERAFLIMCDESKRIDVHMLYGYIEHFGGTKPNKKEVQQFFDFMKPNASEMVTFSKFVRAIDDDGDVIAAMKRFLESGDSRSKK